MKIKDRFVLGLVSGIAGNLLKTAVDELSMRRNISQRSFRTTAAGIWVNKKSQAESPLGQLLGTIFDFGFASLGGVGTVYLLAKTGRDHVILKGLASGIVYGSSISFLLSAFPQNKVSPKDAASTLSYMLSHGVLGVTTACVAAFLGHPSIYDTSPHNDYLAPTEQTTEEIALQKKQQQQQPPSLH
jgi:hypothetical protein